MVPRLQFQARAALVFGELHNSILMDRVRGISYNTNFKTIQQQTQLYASDPYRASDHDPVVVGLNLVAPAARWAFQVRRAALAWAR